MLRRLLFALLVASAACSGSAPEEVPSTSEGPSEPDAAASPSPSYDAGPPVDAADADAGATPPSLSEIVGLSAVPETCASTACEAKRKAFFARLADLGVKKIRADLLWSSVAPSRTVLDFSATDRMVNAARAAGVEVLGILCYGARWATTHDDEHYPPDDLDDFVAYAKAIAKHYDGVIDRYEVWNEPNAGFRFWKSSFGGDPKVFGDLVTRTARALRTLPLTKPVTVAPGGTVYISQFVPIFPPGTVPPGIDFAREAFAKNPDLAKETNAFAFHAYNVYPPRNGPESTGLAEVPFDEKVTATRTMLGQASATARPLWLTEIGWPTANGVDEDAQARWSIRAVLLAAAARIESVYLYTLYDSEAPAPITPVPEGSFGIAHADGSPKAAFTAIKATLAMAGKLHVVGPVKLASAPGDVHALELAGPAGARAWVAWRGDDGQGAWTWKLPPEVKGTIRALDGTSLGKTGAELPITPKPTWVLGDP